MNRDAFHQRLIEIITNDVRRQKLQFVGVFSLLAAVAAFMTVVNVFTVKKTLTWVTLTFSLLCLLNLFITLRFEKKGLRLAAWLLMIEMIAMFTFFIVSGNPDGFSAIWICLLPSCGMLLFGIRSTSGLCAVMMAIMVFFFWTAPGRNLLQYSYTTTFMTRFPILFVASFLLSCLLEIIQSVTQRELSSLRRKYEYLYRHDALTKLLNRNGLNEWEKKETKKGRQVALMADIDHFKQVNDRYGHDVGDLVLSLVATTMEKELKTRVCRWGGEEFVVWSPDGRLTPKDAERLRAAIEEMTVFVPNCDKSFRITISIGGARGTAETPLNELIKTADEHLYEAKQSGRNRVIFPEGEEKAAEG